MTVAERNLKAFSRAVEALAPHLSNVVFIGGWAQYLYSLHPEAVPLPFEPLFTQDLDVAISQCIPAGGKAIGELLERAGFRESLSGDHSPPVSEYVLDGEDGFYLEFLSPLVGSEVKRGGRMDATARISGVTTQRLRHLDLLLLSPWSVTLSQSSGFPLVHPRSVQIPNPAAYIAQKVLVFQKRRPADQAKDLVYIYDTLLAFSDAFESVNEEWRELSRKMHSNHVKRFEKQVRERILQTSDVLRAAAIIVASRPSAPTAEQLLSALRLGYREAFGITAKPAG